MLPYLRKKDPGDSGLCGLCGYGGHCFPGRSSLSLVVTMASESRLTHRDGLELVHGNGDPGGQSKPFHLLYIGESEACLSAVCLYLWKIHLGVILKLRLIVFLSKWEMGMYE